jgi:ethanolamine permease
LLVLFPEVDFTFSVVLPLGISLVTGGQIFSWNTGLQNGFWEFFISLLIMAFAYLCLMLSLSEITSSLPFSGGLYGFVRVSLGPLWGYLVGCCELVQNVFYVSAIALSLGKAFALITGLPSRYEPVAWLLFYVSSFYINFYDGNKRVYQIDEGREHHNHQWFWRTQSILSVVCVVLIILYIAVTIPHMNFNKYSLTSHHSLHQHQDSSSGGFIQRLISSLCFSSLMFIGSESLTLTCIDVNSPKSQIPTAMNWSYITIVITAVSLLFAIASQEPGVEEISSSFFPLDYGFSRFFQISRNQATWLSIPLIYTKGYSFMFCYGRQISSMIRSSLLPSLPAFFHSFFSGTYCSSKESTSPKLGLIVGTILSVLVTIVWFFTFPSNFTSSSSSSFSSITFLLQLCLLSSYCIYIFTLLSYLIMKSKYSILVRSYRSPLGTFGAISGIILFLFGIISIIGFNDSLKKGENALIGFIVIMIIFVLLYFFMIRHKQSFSIDEQKTLFSAYLINGKNAPPSLLLSFYLFFSFLSCL